MNNFILTFINNFGYIGIFLLIAIENIFPPLPSELILTFSGFISKSANLNIFFIIIFATLGSYIGAIILYFLGYIFNNKILNIVDTKIGKLLHLNKNNINNSINNFNEYGKKTVFLGRLIPIIRSLISIPAGITKMNLLIFSIYTIIGSFIWNTVLVLLGNMIGDNYMYIIKFINNYYKPIIILIIIMFIIKHIKKQSPK